MADGLQMGNLSLNESQHAPQGGPPGRAAYIPPHLRQRGPGAGGDSAPPPGPGFGGPRYVFHCQSQQASSCRKFQCANLCLEQRPRWQLG